MPIASWGWTSSVTGGFSGGTDWCCWKCFRNHHSKNNSFMCTTAFTKLVPHLLCPFLKRSIWFCENKGMRGLALQVKGFYSTAYIAISRSWKCIPILSMKEKLILLIQFFFFGCCFLFSPLHLLFYCRAHGGGKWALFISPVLFSVKANSIVFN